VQTLDLEALAAHRGSLFGAMPGGQPSQKAFESRLHDALSRLDPARPVVVEAESSRIGARVIPPALWTAMAAAPVIGIDSPWPSGPRRPYRAGPMPRSRPIKVALDTGARPTAAASHSKATITEWRAMATLGARSPTSPGN
jgi:tRNA 2-selenouridine synthase